MLVDDLLSLTQGRGDRVFTRSFIRADLFSSRDDTVASTFRKAKQIVDQHGPSLFNDGVDSRQV